MLAVPAADEVKVAVHVAVPTVALATRVHGEPVKMKVPVAIPVAEKLTVPVGVTAVPAAVLSATEAVQVEA